jgi:hypothetical protein
MSLHPHATEPSFLQIPLSLTTQKIERSCKQIEGLTKFFGDQMASEKKYEAAMGKIAQTDLAGWETDESTASLGLKNLEQYAAGICTQHQQVAKTLEEKLVKPLKDLKGRMQMRVKNLKAEQLSVSKEVQRAQENVAKARKHKSKTHNDETLVSNSLRSKRGLLDGTSGQVVLQKDMPNLQKEVKSLEQKLDSAQKFSAQSDRDFEFAVKSLYGNVEKKDEMNSSIARSYQSLEEERLDHIVTSMHEFIAMENEYLRVRKINLEQMEQVCAALAPVQDVHQFANKFRCPDKTHRQSKALKLVELYAMDPAAEVVLASSGGSSPPSDGARPGSFSGSGAGADGSRFSGGLFAGASTRINSIFGKSSARAVSAPASANVATELAEGSLFGPAPTAGAPAVAADANIFGAVPASVDSPANIFGAAPAPTNIFGATMPAAPVDSPANIFGAPTAAPEANIFGAATPAPAPAAAPGVVVAEGECTEAQVQVLESVIQQIFLINNPNNFSTPSLGAVVPTVQQLPAHLQSEKARKTFLRLLNEMRSVNTDVGKGYKPLAECLCSFLDVCADKNDVKCAMTTMILSETFYRERPESATPAPAVAVASPGQGPGRGGFQFVHEEIRSHGIWRKMSLWKDALLIGIQDELAKIPQRDAWYNQHGGVGTHHLACAILYAPLSMCHSLRTT